MNALFLFLTVLGFMGGLFWVAHIAEKETVFAKTITRSPLLYTMALVVYCTSWTFYGSVGKAATAGLSFLGVYIGPTIMMALWWLLLRQLVLIKDKYHITSIADFISARYGKSQILAAVVTLIALVGNMPYIALQLKSIRSSFNLIADISDPTGSWISGHFGPCIILLMTVFTILFGARRLDPTERHRGMVTVIALQSVIKLVSFLACGLYVTFSLAGGFDEIFGQTFLQHPTAAAVLRFGDDGNAYVTWMTLIVLSMGAIMFLPRQFHMAVVENAHQKNILTAIWLFPLSLVLITFFVVPIAIYGINIGIPVQEADTYVLSIPLFHGHFWMAILVFLGGLSAAMSMVMIAAVAMATMTVNHILLPLFSLTPTLAAMRRFLLHWRWICIAGILSVGYWTETKLGDSYALVNMGLISFAAVAQFAPAGIGALVWPKGNRIGALTGLCIGFAIWGYTLLLPAFIKSGWIDRSLLDHGPWGIHFLKPESLFGLTALPSLSHSVFWSLLWNVGLYVLISCLTRQGEEEERIARDFHTIIETAQVTHLGVASVRTVHLASKQTALLEVLGEYFSQDKSAAILNRVLRQCNLLEKKAVSIIDYAELHRAIESTLAGSIGSAMAHRALRREAIFSSVEKKLLSKAYAEILSRLTISPQELAEKINFYREREDLLTTHSKELEKRIREKEHEIEVRKQVESALKQAEQQYRSIFDNALEGIFQISTDGAFLTVNPAMATILGYESPMALKAVAPNFRSHFGDDSERWAQLFTQLATTNHVKDFEIRATHAGGRMLWLNLNARPVLNAQGQMVKIEGIAEDITKRKEAEEKLARHHLELEKKVRQRTAEVHENQAFLQEVLEGIQAAVIVVHQDTQEILDCNAILEQLLGYDRQALVSSGGPLQRDNALFSDLREKSLNRELVVKRENGSMIPVLRNVLPVVYKGVPAYAIILFDISERKALEQQVNMAQKLQAIGQLAAGIAHEINTPIQYIGSNIQFLSESFNQLMELHQEYSELMARARITGELDESIEEISKRIKELDLEFLLEEIPHAVKESLAGIDQVAAIVLAMKQFAHPEQENVALVDINTALEQTAAISRNEWKYVAELKLELDPAKPVITGYPGPLNQVFLNILINAAHAIGERMEQTGRKGEIRIRTTGTSEKVVITIADTGCGIPPEIRQKIFEPFFTTKAVGKGTGQGLNIAYTIITKKHQGTIDVESEVGEGSTFFITLPVQPKG